MKSRFALPRLSAQIAVAFVTMFGAGCGYTFQGSGSILPPDVKTIAIPLAENDTTEPGVAQRFTESLRSRFDRYGAVKVISETSQADVVLLARVVDVDTHIAGTTSNTDIELSNDLTITVSAELRRKSGQILYRNPSMNISNTFAKAGSSVVTSSSQFAEGSVAASTLSNLNDREVAREEGDLALSNLLDEASRRIYLEAVAADF